MACRRCTNYIFILDLTLGFNGLRKVNYKTRRETFKFWDLVRLTLEVWRCDDFTCSYVCSERHVYMYYPTFCNSTISSNIRFMCSFLCLNRHQAASIWKNSVIIVLFIRFQMTSPEPGELYGFCYFVPKVVTLSLTCWAQFKFIHQSAVEPA